MVGQPNFAMVLRKAQRLAKRELADTKSSFSQEEVTLEWMWCGHVVGEPYVKADISEKNNNN